MQVMPATAKELGIKDVSDPIESLRGGTTYLNILYNRFKDIEDDETRIKFTLALFNCGYEHVRDAQRLADFNNLDPTVWENNVAEMFLELRFRKTIIEIL